MDEKYYGLRDAFIETIRFLIVEEDWEYFRVEFLYAGDTKKETCSERNAEKIRRFIRNLAEKDPIVKECIEVASNENT